MLRRYWIALAHPTIRFHREVTASNPEEALAQASALFELGDVIVGQDADEVVRAAACMSSMRRERASSVALQGENQPPSASDGTTGATS